MRVAHRHHFIFAEKDERISATQLPERLDNAVDQRCSARGGDEMEDNLGVYGGLKDRPVGLQAVTQLFRVDEIAVVDYGQGAVSVFHNQRLAALEDRRTSSGIAVVADCAQSFKAADDFLVENVGHQPHATVD